MNDQQIYELIAKTPKIRAVTVADSLDVALEDARAALQALVAVGDVEEHKIFAPNGLPDTGYSFTEEFRKTKEYRALLSLIPATDQDISPVQRAIAFVKERGSATSAELHAVMGLAPDQYASSYLAGTVRAGKLIKDGRSYLLGLGGPPERAADAIAKAERKTKPAPAKVDVQHQLGRIASGKTAVHEEPKAAPVKTSVFRCGLWSDDVLELQRDGVQVAKLTRNEGEHFAAFMGRMLGVAEQAASD